MVGYIGFHSRPNPPYLQPLVADAVELGYTVFPPFRARGFATEAVIALIGWAHRSAGIDNFVVSIAPDNEPSRAIAARLGFRRVGEHTRRVRRLRGGVPAGRRGGAGGHRAERTCGSRDARNLSGPRRDRASLAQCAAHAGP